MHFLEEIKALLREKSGKKLLCLSAAVFLLITAAVFFATFRISGLAHQKRMEEYLGEIPNIVESRRNELLMRLDVCEEGYMTCADFGLILYREEDGLTEAERLERVRAGVRADSVSLLDEQGAVLFTTGVACPEESFHNCVQSLEPRDVQVELYPARSKSGEETGKADGKAFVRLLLPENTKHSLVFEFSCDQILKVYNTLDDWSDVLDRMLSGLDATAFAICDGKVIGYPLDGLTDDETSRLYEEVAGVIRNRDSFRKTGNVSVRLIQLMGKNHFAVMTRYSQEETDILLTVPLMDVIKNALFIAATISAIIGWGILLIQNYIYRQLVRKKEENEKIIISRKWVWQATWPGLLVMLVVTIVFSGMLLQLESRTNTSVTATSKRISLQHEIDARKGLEGTIRRTFENCYLDRTLALANFLSEHPEEYETRTGLEKLSRIAGADYLMRFDRDGQETVASNSYTGFSADKNLSEEYQAVMLGYPSAVAGPAADPYTGQMQLGAAILMTKNGEPDGFLLAKYSAGDLNSELKRMSAESAVNSFAVQKGQVAAMVRDKDGVFTAHTDPGMIGQKAEDYLEEYESGTSFEGYSDYRGHRVCISAVSSDGKTLLYMAPDHGNYESHSNAILIGVMILLILTLLYYPTAGLLIGEAMDEAAGRFQPQDKKRNPITVFSDGYAIFLTPFALIALIASSSGWWTSFDYVFSGQWSKGVHLFSVWAALFVTAVTICFVCLVRTSLHRLENRFSIRTKTIARLLGSANSYFATVFLLISVLGMFGVDTKVLVTSAGIVSIAVGMGAQSMAYDLLAGLFMMMEGTVHVGDYVSIGGSRSGVTGRVVDMGIRTMKIIDKDDNLVIINNREASSVINMNHKLEKLEEGQESSLAYRLEDKTENSGGNSPESGKENARESAPKSEKPEAQESAPKSEKPEAQESAPKSEKPDAQGSAPESGKPEAQGSAPQSGTENTRGSKAGNRPGKRHNHGRKRH